MQHRILEAMRKDKRKGRVFLLQSKNPACFARLLNGLPQNVVLMTTIETNRDSICAEVSKAPLPSLRFQDFLHLDWPRKALVMEPIIDFDLDVIVEWVTKLKPETIMIGSASKGRRNLPEPSHLKVLELHKELQGLGFKTYDKKDFKYLNVF